MIVHNQFSSQRAQGEHMMRNRFGRYTVVALISVVVGGVLGAGCSDVGGESHNETEGLPKTAPTAMMRPGAKKPAVDPKIDLPAGK